VIKRQIEVINKLGLHARAATKLVNKASGFESDIRLNRDGQQVDAKSIMGIMMLAACQGTELEIVVSGSDEQHALDSIVGLFCSRFEEEE
jgi:phosphocarrier protein HPr